MACVHTTYSSMPGLYVLLHMVCTHVQNVPKMVDSWVVTPDTPKWYVRSIRTPTAWHVCILRIPLCQACRCLCVCVYTTRRNAPNTPYVGGDPWSLTPHLGVLLWYVPHVLWWYVYYYTTACGCTTWIHRSTHTHSRYMDALMYTSRVPHG
jgi:hypothetical protein